MTKPTLKLSDLLEYAEYGRMIFLENPEKAIKLLKSILVSYEDKLDDYQISVIYEGIAERYFDIGKYDCGIKNYKNAIRISNNSLVSEFHLAKSLNDRNIDREYANRIVDRCILRIIKSNFAEIDDEFSREEYLSMFRGLKGL